MPKKVAERDDTAWALMLHVTRFVNVTFGRRLGGSRSLYDAIRTAKADGYSDNEIRIAFWVVRCAQDQAGWLTTELSKNGMPELALRHQGGLNRWGQPARRWLDELISQARETNGAMVAAILDRLPEDMKAGERELLAAMEVPIEP